MEPLTRRLSLTVAVLTTVLSILHPPSRSQANVLGDKSPTATCTAPTHPPVALLNRPLQQRLTTAYSQLPIGFERNTGQEDPIVKFVAQRDTYRLFLTAHGAVLSLACPKSTDLRGGRHQTQ